MIYYKETLKDIFPENEDEIILRPGQSHDFRFDLDHPDDLHHHNFVLYMKGDSTLHPFWKSEQDFPEQYQLLDDALETDHACRSQYCLNFSSSGDNYKRCVYKKLLFPAILSYLPLYGNNNQWRAGIWVKSDSLCVDTGGTLRFTIEVRRKKAGVDRRDVMHPADHVYIIEMPQGSCGWTKLSRQIELEPDVASVVFLLEGYGYTGNVWFESPFFLSSNNINLLPDFSVRSTQRKAFNWLGVNISRKEWPEFTITVNNRRIHSGEMYERIHIDPAFEFPIPKDILRYAENTVSVTLTSRFREAPPFAIKSLSLLLTPTKKMKVVACPEIVAAGRPFSILVDTANDNATLCISGDLGNENTTLGPCGLHTVQLTARKPGLDISFTVTCDGDTEICSLGRVVEKPCDDVFTGTGDAIYINQNIPEMERFLAWYAGNEVGNLITFRPVYRWSGSRVLVPEVWARVKELVNGLGLKYVHMVDGRELPGCAANPTYEMLAGPNFLGRQNHERDGAHAYWAIPGRIDISGDSDAEQYYDLWVREPDSVGYCTDRTNYILQDGKTYINRNLDLDPDMRQAAEHFISQAALERGGAPRHTGPSTLFKYFYQAGYEWLGAELMYGPQEIVIAALRGSSRAYGKTAIGGHLAVQWSTTPHDRPERYLRYKLALFTSYIQGLTEINTEEGLWHIEEYYQEFDRFSNACLEHKKVQQDFYRYVASHTRKGHFYTPMAFLHGRYDGWQCFDRNTVWGMNHEHYRFSKAEESWDLLKILFPLSRLDAIYLHPCENKPSGFYTGTPFGCADIIPAEADGGLFSRYGMLCFLGYHAAEAGDLEKLHAYVQNGGTLLLGWPHLNDSLDRTEIIVNNFRFVDSPLIRIFTGLSGAAPRFEAVRTPDGHTVMAAVNLELSDLEVLAVSDDNVPLAIRKPLGKGNIYFVNIKAWPAEDGARTIYGSLIRRAAVETGMKERSRGWIACASDVQFTVYDCDDGSRDLYVLAVDWYNAHGAPRRATLLLGKRQWPIEINGLKRISVKDGVAAWPVEESSEIRFMMTENAGNLKLGLQGEGRCDFMLAGGKFIPSENLTFESDHLYRLTTDFGKQGIRTESVDMYGDKKKRGR